LDDITSMYLADAFIQSDLFRLYICFISVCSLRIPEHKSTYLSFAYTLLATFSNYGINYMVDYGICLRCKYMLRLKYWKDWLLEIRVTKIHFLYIIFSIEFCLMHYFTITLVFFFTPLNTFKSYLNPLNTYTFH